MNYKIKGNQHISRDCMVCGVENDFGLKSRFFETEENEVIALFTPRQCHQSYPRITHGGIIAAILDETIGRAIMCQYGGTTFGVTVELNVKYKRPVPYDVELKAIGRITSDKGRIFEGTGLQRQRGNICAVPLRSSPTPNLSTISGSDLRIFPLKSICR